MCWWLKLKEYDYEVLYKEGKQNINADALSRMSQILVFKQKPQLATIKFLIIVYFCNMYRMIRYGKYKIYTSTNFGQNQKITYKEINSFLKIKITLSKNEENKIENLTLTSGNINIIRKINRNKPYQRKQSITHKFRNGI